MEVKSSEISDGFFLPNVFLNVSDPDSSINGYFEIVLLNFKEFFQVIPNMAANNLLSRIRVRNGTKLASTARSYILELEAKETKSVNPVSSPMSKATVFLKINSNFLEIPRFPEESYITEIQENAGQGALLTIIKVRLFIFC